jgi:hypothetical protein
LYSASRKKPLAEPQKKPAKRRAKTTKKWGNKWGAERFKKHLNHCFSKT